MMLKIYSQLTKSFCLQAGVKALFYWQKEEMAYGEGSLASLLLSMFHHQSNSFIIFNSKYLELKRTIHNGQIPHRISLIIP